MGRSVISYWSSKRVRFNVGLVVIGVVAFIVSEILADKYIVPHKNDFDHTFFSVFLDFIGYVVFMLLANFFYDVFQYLDKKVNKKKSINFTRSFYVLAFVTCSAVPLFLPVSIILYAMSHNLL